MSATTYSTRLPTANDLMGCGSRTTGKFHFYKNCVLSLALAIPLSGCSHSVNWKYERTPSTAFAEPKSTQVGALFQADADKHPGLSGFSLIQQGADAFMARIAMADLAEKSIDAQYYIWDGDISGKILASHLEKAAQRGVRVRLLLDDNYMTQDRDFRLAILDSHPNIEIRFFNPVSNRKRRMMSFLGDFSRVNRRMHNKLFVMDNAVGIVGGRNIANIYFGVEAKQNFRDLDVMAAGPVVNELSSSFDDYWNSEWAVPVGAVVRKLPSEQELGPVIKKLDEEIASTGYPYPIYQSVDELRARLVGFRDRFIWAPGHVLVEDPSRVNQTDAPKVIATALQERINQAQREVSIESPYFVLPEPTIERVRETIARGVRVRVLTNSAASNDVMATHAGYANTRKALIKAGVELYELSVDSNMKRSWSILATKSKASLHSKTMLFDRQTVWIGSFNLDPRSAVLNTEIGVMIESPELAAQVGELMDEGAAPGSAFRVTLDEDNDLLWTAENSGQKVEFHKDPGTSLWQRFKINLMRMLPIEDQL